MLFVSDNSGKAELEILYKYENTDGIVKQAEELVKIDTYCNSPYTFTLKF
ncbi:MAG: hypothetical protein ACOCZT_00140 [Halanaerobiales bacterium]